jgi:curli biogenesis system outer membrane secretion channel CsgG
MKRLKKLSFIPFFLVLLLCSGSAMPQDLQDSFFNDVTGTTSRSGSSWNWGKKEQDDSSSQDREQAPQNYAPYSGPKTTLAIIGFENKSKGAYGSWDIGEGLAEMLSTELLKTNRFILIERQALQEILREQELGQTGLVRSGSAPKTGALAGAQLLIKGVVSEFQYKAAGNDGGFSYKGLNFGGKSKTAHVGIDVRVIDATSGQIIASEYASAQATSSGFNLGFDKAGEPLKIGGGSFKKTPLGKATRDAMRQAVSFIIKHSQNVEWKASVVKASGGKIFINRGSSSNVRAGDKFAVYSKGDSLIDPETGLDLGSEEEFSGVLVITTVKKKYAIGHVERRVKGLSIKRGDTVKRN